MFHNLNNQSGSNEAFKRFNEGVFIVSVLVLVLGAILANPDYVWIASGGIVASMIGEIFYRN